MDKEIVKRLLGEMSDKLVKIMLLVNEDEKGLVEASPILQLEEENFRVDSNGWKQFTNGQEITYLENPEKDIWEYVGGVFDELVGQQLFTWPAAMRETEKVGKRMPTDEEFNQFKKEDFGQILYVLYAGDRGTNGAFHYLTSNANFWSSSVSGPNAWYRFLYPSDSTVCRSALNQAYGFSVRCLKD